MTKKLMVPPAERADSLDVGGLHITVLASKMDTGSYEVFHSEGPEGKGPGPHYHPWDESIFVTSGELRCGVDDEEMVASAGSFIHIPAGSVHWFSFGSGGGEFVSMTSKGNASEMFTAFDKGVNWESPDRDALVKLAAEHDQVVIG